MQSQYINFKSPLNFATPAEEIDNAKNIAKLMDLMSFFGNVDRVSHEKSAFDISSLSVISRPTCDALAFQLSFTSNQQPSDEKNGVLVMLGCDGSRAKSFMTNISSSKTFGIRMPGYGQNPGCRIDDAWLDENGMVKAGTILKLAMCHLKPIDSSFRETGRGLFRELLDSKKLKDYFDLHDDESGSSLWNFVLSFFSSSNNKESENQYASYGTVRDCTSIYNELLRPELPPLGLDYLYDEVFSKACENNNAPDRGITDASEEEALHTSSHIEL